MTLRLCVLASAVVMLSASCGFMDPPTPSKDKDEAIPFRIGLTEWGEICNFDNITEETFNPHATCLQVYLAFETLGEIIQRNPSSGSVRISSDGRECVVAIPKGVYFPDGTPLTADDVVYSFNSMKEFASSDKGRYAYFPASDVSAVKVGAREVSLRSKHPRRFNRLLSDIIVISENWGQTHKINESEISIPMGTGPYHVSGVDVKNRKIMMGRNAKFTPAPSRMKKVELVYYRNMEAVAMGFIRNEVDYVPNFGNIENEIIAMSRNHRLLRYKPTYSSALILNTSSPKLKDARVRRALSMIVDRHSMSRTFKGLPETRMPTTSLFNFSYPETEPVAEPTDIKEAFRLLREAGYKREDGEFFLNGKRVELEIGILGDKDVQYVMDAIRLLIKSWEDAGIVCSIKNVSFSDINRNISYEVLFTQAHDGDLSFMLDKILNSDSRGGLYNLDFRDDQLDRLRGEFKNEYREDALRVKKLQIHSRLKEVCPIIPLYYDYGFAAVGPRFSGDETLVAALAKDPGSMTHLHEYR